MSAVDPQHGQRQPELVVEGAAGRDRRAGVGQHLGEHVLGAGLALGAGDREHRQGVGRPATSARRPGRQRLQRRLHVVDDDRGHPGRTRAEDAPRRRPDRGRGVVVPVDVLARERDEQPGGLGAAAVEERRRR